MKLLLPPAAAFAALSLAACQAEPPAAEAQAAAPLDPVVATAVSDVRSAAIDPATGKPRDAGAAFIAVSDSAAPAAPAATLGKVDAGAPSGTFQLQPGTVIIPPDAQAGN